MNFLVDYNLDGYAPVFLGIIVKYGWLEVLPIGFLTLKDVKLSMDISDRVLWDFAQSNQMIILTANRNMKGQDSLEQVIREENNFACFPVVTISDIKRLDEFNYREQCIDRIIEIVIDIENYRGVGRLFIP